jgi:hypothetical protein
VHFNSLCVMVHLIDWLIDCRTGSLHLGPCIRALCAPHWNSFLPSSPEGLRTYWRERPLLARKGNWREFSQQLVIHSRNWDFWHAPKLGHGTDYFTSPPKEGMLRIFSHRKKIHRLRSGGFFFISNSMFRLKGKYHHEFEPANSGTKGQHANH